MDNLIKINEINSGILIKIATVSRNTGDFVYFETPFKYECFIVLFCDFGVGSASIRQQAVEAINNTGFKLVTTATGNDTFRYLAIGY